MERSSRVRSGCLLRCSIFPPRWRRKVRSVRSTTRAPSTPSTARTMASHASSPAASTVMSRSMWPESTATRSTAPIVPPAFPIALATRPSMPGWSAISTRSVRENWALGVPAIRPAILRAEGRGRRPLTGADGALHVARPHGRGLRPGEEDRPRVLTEARAVRGERAGAQAAGRAAAHPGVAGPLLLDPGAGRERAPAEQPGEGAEDMGAPLLLGRARGPVRLGPADEAEQHAGPARGRRDVEGDGRRPAVRHRFAAAAVLAPPRLVVDREALGERAREGAAREADAPRVDRRVPGDRGPQGRGHGDDRPLGPHLLAARTHAHARAPRLDRGDRRLEHDAVAEGLGHREREALRAAREAVLLSAALGVEDEVERSGGGDVEEDEEQREVLRLGAPERLADDAEERAGRRRHRPATQPRGEGLTVERPRPRRRPRPLDVHPGGEAR